MFFFAVVDEHGLADLHSLNLFWPKQMKSVSVALPALLVDLWEVSKSRTFSNIVGLIIYWTC